MVRKESLQRANVLIIVPTYTGVQLYQLSTLDIPRTCSIDFGHDTFFCQAASFLGKPKASQSSNGDTAIGAEEGLG